MELFHNRWSWTHCLDSGSPDAGVQKKKPEALKSCLKMPAESSDPGLSGESAVSVTSS